MKVPYCRNVHSYFAVSPDLDVRLRQPRHAVHPVGQIEAVPVDRGGQRQPVRHVDPDALALHRLDHGAVDAAVVAPAFRPQAGVERVVHFLGDQMEDLHAVDHLERAARAPFGTTTGL